MLRLFAAVFTVQNSRTVFYTVQGVSNNIITQVLNYRNSAKSRLEGTMLDTRYYTL